MKLVAAWVQLKKWVIGWPEKKLRTNFWLVDGMSINSRRVKDGATTWRALDTVYNFKVGEGRSALERWIDYWWLHIRNAQAPRNRLKMAKNELRNAIRSIKTGPGEPVRILSLAAGSAQGVVEVMAKIGQEGIHCQALLIDLEFDALSHAKDLARSYGIESDVAVRQGNVIGFISLLHGFKPDIIEMMGLTDYLPDNVAVKLFAKIRKQLRSGGWFFTSNVHPNPESYFLKWVVDWDMIYRTRTQLADLFIEAGFLTPKVVTEPLGIQCFAMAQKID